MENEIYKTIEEYTRTIEIEGSKDKYISIKGRISQAIESGDIMWEISHYCKPDKTAADVYRPGNETVAMPIDKARHYLFKHMNEFTGISAKANQYY